MGKGHSIVGSLRWQKIVRTDPVPTAELSYHKIVTEKRCYAKNNSFSCFKDSVFLDENSTMFFYIKKEREKMNYSF